MRASSSIDLGLAACIGEDLLDFLVGLQLLLAEIGVRLGPRLAADVLRFLTGERDDVLTGLLCGGEDRGDARADPRIVLRSLDLGGRLDLLLLL